MQTENGTQIEPVAQPETLQAPQTIAQPAQLNELSLWNMCRIIFSKWKILLIVLLVSVIGGASVAFFQTRGENYYGTYLEFYVTPIKPKDNQTQEEGSTAVYGAYNKSVMDNIIKLLSSEWFAESLIQKTEAEGGLPDKYKVQKFDEQGEITAA